MSDNATERSAGPEVDLGLVGRSLAFVLRRAQAAVAEDFKARFGPEDIRPGQFALLSVLGANPGIRQNRLSAALGLQRTNLVPLLDELERRGLVERRRTSTDRRAAALALTAAGTALLQRLTALAEAHEAHFAARLGGEQNRYALIALLQRLAEPAFDPPA
jgi:DNA-binding MarR family transcriptional regulator